MSSPVSPSQRSPRGWRSQLLWLTWLLPVVVVAVLYAQVRGHLFVDFDDGYYTFENGIIIQGLTWEGVKWAFTETFAANYHPLTWISHMLDYEIFGTLPGMFAAVNASLHAANSLLVAILFAFLFRSRAVGVTVGVVFAAHPKLVEAVAWISQRKTLLSTLFALGAIILFLHAVDPTRERVHRRSYAAALGLYLLSLLSKGMYVTMPAILLVLEMVALEQRHVASASDAPNALVKLFHISTDNLRRIATRLIPFAVLALLFSGITYWAQARGEAVQSFENLPLSDRLPTALAGMMTYLRHYFYPVGLSVYYPRPEDWPLLAYFGSGVVLVAITAGLLALIPKTGRTPALGWLLFLGMLLPVIGIIQVGDQASADRYMYGPIIGLLVACTAIGLSLRSAVKERRLLVLMQAGLCAWVTFAGVITYKQVGNWQNAYSLGRSSELAVGPISPLLNIQVTFLLRYRKADEAIAIAERGVRLDPESPALVQNLSLGWFLKENFDEAIRWGKRAVELEPDASLPYVNMAMFLEAKGDLKQARIFLDKGMSIPGRNLSTENMIETLDRSLKERLPAGTETPPTP